MIKSENGTNFGSILHVTRRLRRACGTLSDEDDAGDYNPRGWPFQNSQPLFNAFLSPNSRRNQLPSSLRKAPGGKHSFDQKDQKGIMGVRLGLLFLVVFGVCWASDARQLQTSDVASKSIGFSDLAAVLIKSHPEQGGVLPTDPDDGNENVCTLCERLISEALDLLSQNKTQKLIIEMLHATCNELQPFKQQCITLVDYYALLIFDELTVITPNNFCIRANLCGPQVTVRRFDQDSCVFCRHAIDEVIFKLRDPDTQLEILELLLKGCDAVEGLVRKCKRMVFEYGPIILNNTERFLEKNDVCTTVHACTVPPAAEMHEAAAAVADS